MGEANAVRVGVRVNNVGGYSRGVIRGVASFAASRGWVCRAQGVNVHDIGSHDAGRYDGLIVQAADDELRRLMGLGVPVVNVSSAIERDRKSVV